MRSDINIIIVIVIATSEWRAPRGRVCLIQDTRCGHAWLTQIRRVPYGPGERSDAFPGRSPVCRADGRSCGTLAYAPFCSGWPSPVPAGVKHCSCGEPLPHTLALRCSLAHTHTHTHSDEQALGLWGRISSSVNSEGKTNRHQKATYGPLLMEHLSWALTDTVTRMAQWLECFSRPLFWALFDNYIKTLACTIFSFAPLFIFLARMMWLLPLPGLNPKDNWKRWIQRHSESQNPLFYLCM